MGLDRVLDFLGGMSGVQSTPSKFLKLEVPVAMGELNYLSLVLLELSEALKLLDNPQDLELLSFILEAGFLVLPKVCSVPPDIQEYLGSLFVSFYESLN